jgi:hypothetical protein
MRGVPIPPGSGRTIVIGEDDPTREDVRPAEYVVRYSDLYPGKLAYSALVELDDDEREAIANGARIWLTLDGAEVPWSLDVAR